MEEKRARRDELEQQLAALTDSDANIQEQNAGLLARVEALDRLGDESLSARAAHLSVAGLLFMVELLPVLVKALSLMGAPTQYDRISELTDRRAVDNAARRRSGDRRRQRKEDEIEDDMLDREITLGKWANAHVAGEMEKVLDSALKDWSDQVSRTVHGGHAESDGRALSGPVSPGHSTSAAPGSQEVPAPESSTSMAAVSASGTTSTRRAKPRSSVATAPPRSPR